MITRLTDLLRQGGSVATPPPVALDGLEANEPLQFERLLLGLRLTFVAMAGLPLAAFGARAAPSAAAIALAALASTALIAALASRRPQALVRYQLALRVLDCLLVLLVLLNYHAFLGNAYYDAVYVLFVVAAAATHGWRGAALLALVAAGCVLLGRVLLIDAGTLAPEPRHFIDVVFFGLFFALLGTAVAYLMRRSSEAVERRERVWRAVLQQMPGGVAIAHAPSGRLLLGNDQSEQLLGHLFRTGDVRGYAGSGLFHADGAPYAPAELPLARALSTGEVVQAEEIEALQPDGTRSTLQVSAAPVRDRGGQVVAGVVTCDDVTWRKQAENTQRFLAEASKQLAGTLDFEATLASVARLAVPTLADFCVVDVLESDGAIRRVAAAHRDHTRQAVAQAFQKHDPPDPRAPFGTPAVLRTGQAELTPIVTAERLAALARDPEHLRLLKLLRPRSSMNVPLVARGRILGAITFVSTSISRRYGPEDLALAEDLARRAAVALDNARLYHEAQSAIQVRDEFLSSASHDLKNPLVSVKGYAQILGTLAAQESTPISKQVAAGLAKIDRAASKMSTLIDELLDVAHLEAGRPLELRRRPTDLVALAHQAVGEFQLTATRHRLAVDAPVLSLVGLWDAGRLDRVLANLLSNAIKYSPAGGPVRVRLRREQDAQGTWAALEVQDEGMGIPAADLPHVFERFHRGGNVGGQIRGAGIGLAGVRQIVEQHGGTIDVVSREGAGAHFTVRLPLNPPNPRGVRPSAERPPAPAANAPAA